MDKLLKKKKELIIGVVLLLAVILCIVFIVTNNDDKKEKKNESENTEKKIEDVVFTEEDLKASYGVNKEDAINFIKPLFNSDNFEYTAVVTKEAKYLVTVKNTISKQEYQFEVDPVTKSYYEIEK